MNQKNNYKKKHFLISSLAIIIGVLLIIPFNIPNLIVTALEVVLITLFCGPYEKKDELVEANLNKANRFIIIFLLITLIILSFLGNNKVNIPANVFSCIACFAVGLRSILFICFDGYIKMDEGE